MGTHLTNKGWRNRYFFVKPPRQPEQITAWCYPLTEPFNQKDFCLTKDEIEVIDKIEALGEYKFDRLMKAYGGGASTFSILLKPDRPVVLSESNEPAKRPRGSEMAEGTQSGSEQQGIVIPVDPERGIGHNLFFMSFLLHT